MALKFDRNFKNGRQSEQFLNDELITLYEILKYLPHHKIDNEGAMPPEAKLAGALNAQVPANAYDDSSLNYWDTGKQAWIPFFSKKFQITDQILYSVCPSDPVVGQLWINNGVLCYFDGAEWHPIKSVSLDDSQWSSAAFADFELISPLDPIGQYNVPIESEITSSGTEDEFIYHYTLSFTVVDPSTHKYQTDYLYQSNRSELEVYLNGILLVRGRDWDELRPDDSIPTGQGHICVGILFHIPLMRNDVITYTINRRILNRTGGASQEVTTVGEDNEDYYQYFYKNELDYISDNIVVPSGEKWYPGWTSPELAEPQPVVITNEYKSQFIVPNIKFDRTFIDNTFDDKYERVSSVCFQYPVPKILDKTVSAVHLNPGKLTGIKKRLVKVDKLNATIAVSPYNTEFYGFRSGEVGGSFLLPSNSQDYGDYMPVGDHIILNYHSNQNYDYILAITYEFTWLKSNGSLAKSTAADNNNTFYLTNLQTPLNIHVNGLKLEEASYDIDTVSKTVTVDDDVDNVTVDAWSPYKKQFGYIRETDLTGRGIIKLHEPVHIPLVFVGGTLIHPLFGGLEFVEDKIYVPNSGGLNQMKNMAWCVVDLVSDDFDVQFEQHGHPEETGRQLQSGSNDHFEEPNRMYYDGIMSDQPDSTGIHSFVIGAHTETGSTGLIIKYNTDAVGPNDSILLFVDGLLVNEADIIRDTTAGSITLVGGLREDQEYVLLKDRDNAIYNSSNMIAAFSVGYLSESLIYLNGKILGNMNCVKTLNTPEEEIKDGAVDYEIKYFITDEITGAGNWKIYDQFTYTWKNLTTAEKNAVLAIASSYENMLTSVRIDVPYDKYTDDVVIYSFRFANALAGLMEIGTAQFINRDEDFKPVFTLGVPYFKYGANTLNVYRNGVKLTEELDFEELPDGKTFRILSDYEENDVIQFVVEPVEHGYEYGHLTLTMTKDNALQPNIYRLSKDITASLYPGRLTVYINGVRIPNTDWTLLDNRTILLKYDDYKAVGSADNYPDEDFIDNNANVITIRHNYPDRITVEIRYDYDRKEKTVFIPTGTSLNELPVETYDIDHTILESKDEILFYLNGQFAGLTRNKNNDYVLDRYKGCISFFNSKFIEAASQDELKNLFDRDNYIYTSWKQMTGKNAYRPDKTNALTIVWRD